VNFTFHDNAVGQLNPPVRAMRGLYLQRTAVVRQDEVDHTWYVVHRMNGHRVVTRQHLHSWEAAMASALHWVGLA
jgi:hypothetical protein